MVFSLASVTGTIHNEIYGDIEFGGGNQTIGSIGYSFDQKAFSLTSYADGGAVISHNKSKAGSITIQISQTSSKYRELVRFAKWCYANPQLAESNLTVRDTTGIMRFTAYGVFPEQEPDESVGETPSNVNIVLLSTRIVTDKDEV